MQGHMTCEDVRGRLRDVEYHISAWPLFVAGKTGFVSSAAPNEALNRKSLRISPVRLRNGRERRERKRYLSRARHTWHWVQRRRERVSSFQNPFGKNISCFLNLNLATRTLVRSWKDKSDRGHALASERREKETGKGDEMYSRPFMRVPESTYMRCLPRVSVCVCPSIRKIYQQMI